MVGGHPRYAARHRTSGAFVVSLATVLSGVGLSSALAAEPIVIDNGSPQFSTVGTWPTSVSIPGFQGANYQTHASRGETPGAIIVDNGGPGFGVTGTWPLSTVVGGFLGPNYQTHEANGEEPSAVAVDNVQGAATGTWTVSTSVGGYYRTNYQAHAPGSSTETFSWSVTVPQTGTYAVYARWTAASNRSAQALYTVTHAGGTTPVSVNQRANGGTWVLLGQFTLSAGSTSVTLTPQTDGYVIADAVKIVPPGAAPNTATWMPAVPEAKPYRVYARWSSYPNRATDATYVITHAGGTSSVTVNQQQGGGQWQLLGTYTLAPGQGHKIELSDRANGYVVADAVRVLPLDAPEYNSATWTPNVTGSYEVYAKWTASENRASDATYAITHSNGSTTIVTDQRAAGGQWNLLGTFKLTSGSTITLTDNANGYVIADAIQLVAKNPVQAMYFVHTDQLGTPRVITNEQAEVVWQWNNDDPFGNNAANDDPRNIGTSFTCNLRFAGQYFDKETNLAYNYFRDYDPAIGRYIKSDPIGLAGGINTYGYVGGNPLSFADPSGLFLQQLLNPIMWGPPLAIAGIWAANNPQAARALWNAISSSSSSSNPPSGGATPPSSSPGDYCLQNPNDPMCQGGQQPQQQCTIPDSRAPHIFRSASGHIPDTPANRQLLVNVASNPRNLLGTDQYGNLWYAQTQGNGTQVWVQVRNGQVMNGGVNPVPRTFNPQSGLASPRQ